MEKKALVYAAFLLGASAVAQAGGFEEVAGQTRLNFLQRLGTFKLSAFKGPESPARVMA